MNEHYETLGIPPNATQDEIKSAYRKLASKHHPDKGGDTATFQKVQAAYETLGDAQKRAEYDSPQPQHNGFHFHSGDFGGHSFEDILRGFGGFGGFQPPPRRNQTVNLHTTITLDEAFSGKEMVGNVRMPNGKEQVINFKIPPGVQDGTMIRLRELGDDSIPGVPRGDIHLTVTVLGHHEFQREGDDLVKNIDISAFDAMLGLDMEVFTIEGKKLNVTIPEGTQPGVTLAAQGHGMPNMHDNRFRGRLLLRINVVVPTNLSDLQKDLIRQAKN
jgi:curved DNA-binding protein